MSHVKNHLRETEKGIEYYLLKHGNLIVLGDFNAEMSNPHMSEFCALYDFTNLIQEPTCYQNIDWSHLNKSCKMFHHTGIYEMGLTDFHKLTLTDLKMFYAKQKPKKIKYKDNKNFNSVIFRRIS